MNHDTTTTHRTLDAHAGHGGGSATKLYDVYGDQPGRIRADLAEMLLLRRAMYRHVY
jgi:hypothetical protein